MKKIVSFIALLMVFMFTPPARASGTNIEISPPTAHILLQPGKTATLIYTIANRADPAILSITATSNQTDAVSQNALTFDTQPFFFGK